MCLFEQIAFEVPLALGVAAGSGGERAVSLRTQVTPVAQPSFTFQ